MAIPGTPVLEGDTLPSGQRTTGDVSRGLFVGAALRGPSDRPVEITTGTDVKNLLGDPFGGSFLARSVTAFLAEGGGSAYVQRAVDATAVNATASIPGATGNVLTVTADGPGTWGNNLSFKVEDGTVAGRKKLTILDGTTVRSQGEAGSAIEAVQRLTLAGVAKVATSSGTWPPPNGTTSLTGGVANDSAVTEANIITAIGKLNSALGPGTILAPGWTSETIHEALLAHAQANGRFALLDYPDIQDVPTLVAQAAQVRAAGSEKLARYGWALYPWVPISTGAFLTIALPPSGLVAGAIARADKNDPQQQARAAAGPAYTFRTAVGVTRVQTDTDWDTLYTAGINLIRQEQEGVCVMGSHTPVDTTRWPQYTFIAGARVRMAIVDRARTAVRPFLFKALDGQGVRLEAIRGAVENVCKPFSQEPISGLFDRGGDGGYKVTIVSSLAELAAGKVRVQLALRTSPTIEQVVIEFSAVAITDAL